MELSVILKSLLLYVHWVNPIHITDSKKMSTHYM